MPLDEETKKVRRTYGRGYLDGLVSAGITDIEAHMNNAKLIALEKRQNGIARKVLFSIPVDTPVTRTQVIAALAERGVHANPRVIDGCLSKLMEEGLIKPDGTNTFHRVGLKRTGPPPPDEPRVFLRNPVIPPETAAVLSPPPPALSVVPNNSPSQTETPADPAERLGALAASLRRLAEEAKRLATEAEEVALAVEAAKDQAPNIDTLAEEFAAFLRKKHSP